MADFSDMRTSEDLAPEPGSGRFLASELGLRVASAVVLVLLVLSATWAGGAWFTVLCAALSAVLFYEWQRIVRRTPFDAPEALLTAGFVAMIGSALIGYPMIGFGGFLVLGFVLEFLSHGDERRDVRWIGLGALYCAIPAIALPLIREVGGDIGLGLVMFTFILVWVTDVAAYFAGRAIGGPKLLPAVSPKKTMSGALGGLVGAMVVGGLFGAYAEGFTPIGAVVAAAVLSVFSQAGDLFESWVKRVHGVKDSSNLIPGHGGFLDRVDGLSAAAVPVAVAVALSAA